MLLDGEYAERIAGQGQPRLPEKGAPSMEPAKEPQAIKRERDLNAALQLLELLQREGRFIDFLKQDIVSFADSDVGAAARIVHQGCRRALDQVAKIEPIRREQEGSAITLEANFDAKEHRLIGNVEGHPPYRGKLTHRGWRITQLTVEEPLPFANLNIVAQAEIEL
jgi:hypothetical protein